MQTSKTFSSIAVMLMIDIVIAVCSWYIPASAELVRTAIATLQLALLVVTAGLTVQWVLRSF